jgi:hypothetical protein
MRLRRALWLAQEDPSLTGSSARVSDAHSSWHTLDEIPGSKRLLQEFESRLLAKPQPAVRGPIGPRKKVLRIREWQKLLGGAPH